MRITSKRLLAVAFSSLLALSAAACSSSDDDDKGAGADQSEANDVDVNGGGDASGDGSSNDGAGSTGGAGSNDGAAASGTATLAIGNNTWEFSELMCGFGEAETGVKGAELNLSARNGSLSLYVAVEPDSTFIEFSDLDEKEPSYMTDGEPNIVISGKSVSTTAQFIEDYESGSRDKISSGTFTATCP